MNRFTRFCTEEQTKRSFELGAPIEFEMEYPVNLDTFERSPYPDIKMGKDGEPILITPTTQQMIDWLEEQGILIDINPINGLHFYWTLRTKELDEGSGKYIWECQYTTDLEYNSRKKATLAAIDAALDYLIKNKKK